jgi:hypothetical protein
MPARESSRRNMPSAELAKVLGISPRRARSYWAEPRADYESQSLCRQRPWEAEGISRSTWYWRRRRADDTKEDEWIF